MNVRQSYREAAVRGATPVELVVRLYEQMIEDLRQVSEAIAHNDIERRTQRIKHAILVLGHLQSSLDFELGGKVARDLDNFYNALRGGLVYVQFHPSKRGVARLITDVLAVRQAWIEVKRVEDEKASLVTPAPVTLPSAPAPEPNRPRVDWKG